MKMTTAGTPRYMRVLIIEDDAATAKSLKDILEGRSEVQFAVEVACSKAEAIKILSRPTEEVGDDIDAILLDLSLPDGEGIDLVREIAEAAGPTVSILVVTGWASQDMEPQVKEAGASDFMTKPASPAEITKRLQYMVIKRKHAEMRHALEGVLAEMGSVVRLLSDPVLFG